MSNEDIFQTMRDLVAEQFGIKTRVIDLTAQKELAIETMSQVATLSQAAIGNLAPRLRMLTLYAIGASENRLVAGTGNASEYHMGYFTKWGDGAYDLDVALCVHQQRAEGRVPAARDCFETSMARLR